MPIEILNESKIVQSSPANKITSYLSSAIFQCCIDEAHDGRLKRDVISILSRHTVKIVHQRLHMKSKKKKKLLQMTSTEQFVCLLSCFLV